MQLAVGWRLLRRPPLRSRGPARAPTPGRDLGAGRTHLEYSERATHRVRVNPASAIAPIGENSTQANAFGSHERARPCSTRRDGSSRKGVTGARCATTARPATSVQRGLGATCTLRRAVRAKRLHRHGRARRPPRSTAEVRRSGGSCVLERRRVEPRATTISAPQNSILRRRPRARRALTRPAVARSCHHGSLSDRTIWCSFKRRALPTCGRAPRQPRRR